MTKEEARKMLANTKVYVNGKGKEIKEKLFGIGYKFEYHIPNIKYPFYKIYPFFYIREDIDVGNDMINFIEDDCKEVSAEDILNIKIDEEFNLKDGDIFCSADTFGSHWISIFNRLEEPKYLTHLDLCTETCNLFSSGVHGFSTIDKITNVRLATEEEKEKLFFSLKKQGLFWNEKTKKIEKIEHKFKPFEKVLVRNYESQKWERRIFMEMNQYNFRTIERSDWGFCIPYEGNEYLLGTNNSPKE